ncbi:MAG TPA: hypothetical protein PLZ05_00275 [Alphaproteobacteria bacterium]|nr:hypothetical protein [Alphaproteobacteria bacterium]
MLKINSFYDILSIITTPKQISTDFYFYKPKQSDIKSSKDNVIIVGEGFSNSSISESNELEYYHELERHRYSLNYVYKFDAETYKIVDYIMINVPVSDFNVCKGIDNENAKTKYFKNALKVKVFNKEIVMGNGLLQKTKKILEYGKDGFTIQVQGSEFKNQMPYYPNTKENYIAYYYPASEINVLEQLKNLELWIKSKLMITEREYIFITKYKAYLDNLAEQWRIYQSSDFKRKDAAMALFEKSAQGK